MRKRRGASKVMIIHITLDQISHYAQCGVYIDSLGPDSFVREFSLLVTCKPCLKVRTKRIARIEKRVKHYG
ncbi:hypothetical protein LCGC14_0429620 [marine sediment metagenome]|uniref:Uncharacterized protein n=1 Tax=marine sediment metagenome TaxID=412755 RepID=A0A0F9VAF1_9ZZZZ